MISIDSLSTQKRVLATLALLGLAIPHVASAEPVFLQEGTATFSQTLGATTSPDQVYDGDLSDVNGWAIARDAGGTPLTAVAETAVWETVTDVPLGTVSFLMQQFHMTTGRSMIGRFRWSVTADDRSTFADGADQNGDIAANWTVLTSPTITVPFGMTAVVLGDQSILTGSSIPFSGQYEIEYSLPFGDVTGIRLEAMEDPSLPQDGPGHSVSNGNFLVTELVVTSQPTELVPALGSAGAIFLVAAIVITYRRSALSRSQPANPS
jgi:hypothetical protein